MKDHVLKVYEDGHEIRQDRWQKIVRHPKTCVNARRGNLRQDYAKETYFTSDHGFQAELWVCHLMFP